ncbi:MAG: SPOR domain-containing protein [Pseudomonadota bacterium]
MDIPTPCPGHDRVLFCRLISGLLFALCLSGCGSRATTEPPATAAAPKGPWFCEPTNDAEDWDCVNSPDRVANPKPSQPLGLLLKRQEEAKRLAEAKAEAEAEAAALAAQRASGNGLDLASMTDSLPAGNDDNMTTTGATAFDVEDDAVDVQDTTAIAATPQTDAAPPAEDDPLYLKLAYRPEQPTSLLELPPEYYAVQLMAFSSPQSLQRFFDTMGVDKLTAAEIESNGELRYVLLLGIYPDFSSAQTATENLPQELEEFEPWIRRLGGLQAAMLRADRRRETASR